MFYRIKVFNSDNSHMFSCSRNAQVGGSVNKYSRVKGLIIVSNCCFKKIIPTIINYVSM